MKEKIAIIGLACLFPGATTPAQYWRNLVAGQDSTSLVTVEEMGIDPTIFYDPVKGRVDKYYCLRGGYVRDFQLDPTGYALPASELVNLDVMHTWALYVAREALRDCGYVDDADVLSKCGVIMGNLSFPTRQSQGVVGPIYQHALQSTLQELLGHAPLPLSGGLGASASCIGKRIVSPATLITRALRLSRISFSLDAACASSLYAVKLACDQLLARRADLMLAGAVSAADPLFINMGFSIFQAYPTEDEASRPLDQASRGLVAGEGAGMFVLKRYADARRDGDKIYAVILGHGVSNDGSGKFLLSPNPKGQILAFERAYADAGVSPESVAYVECHATGTPLGDKVELSSMDAFWGQYAKAPLVGSVKANVGHLLTAAGMAGMLKVVLSLTEGEIPATPRVDKPLESPQRVITAQHVVSSNQKYTQGPRRAGVSAFGFGGTDAHIVLGRESLESLPTSTTSNSPPPKLAIVGMDAFFGPCHNLEAFQRSIYDGVQHFIPLPPTRWKGLDAFPTLLKNYGFSEGKPPLGAYIEAFDIDFLRFKVPPNDMDQPIPQQLLLLRVVDNAVRDAGLAEGQNVAVIVAMEPELALHQFRARCDLSWQIEETLADHNLRLDGQRLRELKTLLKDGIHEPAQVNQYTSFIGNIMACRVAALWDFSGPAFTLSSGENAVFKALSVAQLLLEDRNIEAVIVGAVDLSGGIEHVLLQHQRTPVNTGPHTLSYDQAVTGWSVGEGAGAVVLKRLDVATTQPGRVYAIIDAVALVQDTTTDQFDTASSVANVQRACQEALACADVTPETIEYVEVFGSGIPQEDETELAGLLQAYGGAAETLSDGAPELTCALGSVKANVGHTFAASGMASLIKTALCLYHRYIPATPDWATPKNLASWTTAPFYVPTESRPWFSASPKPRRVAAVNGLGADGTFAHVIVSDVPDQVQRPNRYLSPSADTSSGLSLFPLASDEVGGLLEKLRALRTTVNRTGSLPAAAARCFVAYQKHKSATYALAIVGHDKASVLREIEFALKGVADALDQEREWHSPQGSYFTPTPLGARGTVAFVYPGAFNAYVHLGRDLFQMFPQAYEQLAEITSDVGRVVAGEYLYPRSLTSLSAEDLKARQMRLLDTLPSVIEAGVGFAVLFTTIMRESFKLAPQTALGYSLGEVSMLWALGVWRDADLGSQVLRASPAFRTHLSGPKQTVRAHWRGGAAGDLWGTYTLRAPLDEVRACLKGEDRVYLTIINTPQDVVIAGAPEDCERVIASLGCPYIRAPFDAVLHCDLVRAEITELEKIHTLPLTPVSDVKFYSIDQYAPLRLGEENIACAIAHIATKQVDFPRLINQVYDDGARIFVELGPLATCSRWIGKILKGRAHVTVPLNRAGIDDRLAILSALARLVSHRVPMDLGPLYEHALTPPATEERKRLVKPIIVGGPRLKDKVLTTENKRKFREQVKAASDRSSIPAKDGAGFVSKSPPAKVEPGMGEPLVLPHPVNDNEGNVYFQHLHEHISQVAQNHARFLQMRHMVLKQLRGLIQLQMAAAEKVLDTPAQQQGALSLAVSGHHPIVNQQGGGALSEATEGGDLSLHHSSDVLWDRVDLLEFAKGDIAAVFGEAYAVIDTYRRRVRLPMPPYLLVSRVTDLNAERGVFKPSTIQTEYDIPLDAWYALDGHVPMAVAIESGQCDLLLISYLGIDFANQGERVYRLLECTLTFLDDLPSTGQTLRYDIRINDFARSGASLLFFFSYECFVGQRMILKMENGCAGFFTDAELAQGKGILRTSDEVEARQKIQKTLFEPLLVCSRSTFDKNALLALSEGNLARCFGASYASCSQGACNPSLRLPPAAIHMIDRVVKVDAQGGAWGLGEVIAEKDLHPDDWYFPCHFKDDQVLAGSLVAEGCAQVLQFYLLYLGLQVHTQDARFQPLHGVRQVVRTRKQIPAAFGVLTYRMEVTDVGLTPRPYAKANVEIIFEDTVVADFKNLGLQLSEKPPRAQISKSTSFEKKLALYDESYIKEFATGSLAKCFGPEYVIYDELHAPRIPNGDCQNMTRVVALSAERYKFDNTPSLTSEYDVPFDAWYYRDNSYPMLPYFLYMEIALQPCGFLTGYLGPTLLFPKQEFYFRNLDGQGRILKDVDVRGKCVTNHVRLLSSTTLQGIILQSFDFELSCEGEVFYTGDAGFGYFTASALQNQVGLDQGQLVPPWYVRVPASSVTHLDLTTPTNRARFYHSPVGLTYRALPHGQLDYQDEAFIVEGGGRYQQGYIYTRKAVSPQDWFFPYHFYNDPVMPGSAGVEAVMQALRLYILQQDWGGHLRNPHFDQVVDHVTIWKYRGQIVPTDQEMSLEVHISRVHTEAKQVVVVGDASLWKGQMRIYEVKDAAVCLTDEVV